MLFRSILGPVVIRMFRVPRGPVTGNSSKFPVLAYSNKFCMLVVTDFGSRCDPNVPGTLGSGYGELVKLVVLVILANFVCYYSLILGPAAFQTFEEPRGPVTGNSSKLVVLAYSGQFCML